MKSKNKVELQTFVTFSQRPQLRKLPMQSQDGLRTQEQFLMTIYEDIGIPHVNNSVGITIPKSHK